MVEIALAGWIYFEACGFRLDSLAGEGEYEYPTTKEAPNIHGFWIKRSAIVGVVVWHKHKGPRCTTIYAQGWPHKVNVLGTADEVLKNLQE